MRVQPIGAIAGAPAPGAGGAGRGGGGAQGGRGGPGGGPGGGLTGIPSPLPLSGVDPQNPCGGGGGFGGGAFGGPLVLPGTYNVALVVDGKTVDTKPMKVTTDPAQQMTAVEQKRYYDMAMELHDLQKRASEMSNALGPLYTNMLEVAGKIGGMSNVPAAVKSQFDAANKEFDGIRVKFGVPPSLGGAAPGGGGGGGGRGGPPPANPADLAAAVGTVKTQILTFHDVPSETLVKRAADVRVSLPKAIAEANAFLLTKAMPLSQALKKYDVALTVPSPVK